MQDMRFTKELKKEIFDFAFALHRVTDLFPKDEAVRRQLREYSSEILVNVSGLGFAEDSEKAPLIRGILSRLEVLESLILFSQQTGFMKAINAEVLNRERVALEIYFKHELGALSRSCAMKTGKVAPEKPTAQNDIPAINDTKLSINDILDAQKQREKSEITVSRDAVGDESLEEAEGEQEMQEINERQGAIIGYLRANKEAKMSDLITIFSNRFSVKTLQRDLSRLIINGTVERRGDKRWAVYHLK